MSFYSIEQQNWRDTQTEAFDSLNVILPNRSVIHELKAKVDSGAEVNKFPLHIFQKMLPEKVNTDG